MKHQAGAYSERAKRMSVAGLAVAVERPDGDWVTQQARHVAWTVAERAEPVRVLIRDHDRKFTRSFDDCFGAPAFASFARRFKPPERTGSRNGSCERFAPSVWIGYSS